MSWWNTANFTDLASKALKNAQKKIDSALDIKDEENGSQSTKKGFPKEEKSKGKSDSWGAWAGLSSGESSSSSWSFPWGSGSEGGHEEHPSESLVRVKSAEEIKSEVLKVAKERTKAKAKLFPKTAKTETGSEPEAAETETEKNIETAEIQYESKPELGLEMKSEPTDIASVDNSSKDLRIDTEIEKPPDTGQLYEHSEVEKQLQEVDTKDSGLLEIVRSTGDLTQERLSAVFAKSDSDKNIDTKEDLVAKLEVSTSEDKSLLPSNLSSDNTIDEAMSSSGFQEISEGDFNTGDSSISEYPAVESAQSDIDTSLSGLIETENETQTKGEVKNVDPLQLQKDTETSLDIPKVKPDNFKLRKPEVNITVEGAEKDDSEGKTEVVALDLKDSENKTEDTGITPSVSSGDISSSMEMVSEQDWSAHDKLVEQTDTCEQFGSDPELINEAAASDPEIIECDAQIDETNVDLEKAESFQIVSSKEESCDDEFNTETVSDDTVIAQNDSSQQESSNVSDSSVHHQEIVSQTSEKEDSVVSETAGGEDVLSESSNIPSKELAVTVQTESFSLETKKSFESSDSESSMNKLDASMETCTSEDTVVEQTDTSESAEEKSIPVSQEIDFHTKFEISETADNLNAHGGDKKVKEDDGVFHNDESAMGEADNGKGFQTMSPAHSFVKCMMEDITEAGKHGDDNSDSHSSIEKSEGSRSVYSNHESGDEIDTTTSSDIEIISYPTSNGESRQISPLDPLPLRMALQKTSNWHGSPTHRRTDSSGSSSASGGNYELSPGRECPDYHEYHRSHSEHGEGLRQAPELPALSEEDDNPYHPQRLLKKLAEMSEVVQAREEKLLQLSKENCDLVEANSILRNQLKQSEEAREAEMTDLNELTAEFTKRLTDAEKRVSGAIKEKEIIKKQLQDAQTELAKRAGDVNLKTVLAEKEEQIAGLLQEGEKLSKSQLQSNNIIKKLRQKEKDNDSTITSQKKKIETQTTELEHLRKVLDSKEEVEKKQTEAVAQLTSAVKKQEQDMAKLKSECEDAVEKARGLQVALDNSYKEIAELHKNNAAQDSKAQEAALSAEMQVREELKMALEKQQQQHKWTLESLNMQIEDHRLSMARMEKEYNRREDLLKQEIADLQKQLQEDEARNQELTQGVSQATRPLLRQIENLQSTFNAQSATWEKVEKNLTERLNEAQNQLAIAMEKERTASEQLMELGSKVTALETQNTRLRQERSQLSAQLEMLKTKVEMAEDAKQNEAAQIELMKQQMAQEIQELKKDRVLLESQLDVEKSKVDQEKKKIMMLQDQIRDLEVEMSRSRSRGTPVRATPSPVSVSRQDSMVGSLHEHTFSAITQDELDRSFVLASPNGSKQSLYEALRQSGAANLLENLQSQLKLREGEIAHLQTEIRSLEHTRESMARELVDLSNKNENLEEKLENLPHLEEQYKDLDKRYNALLQMYGEKTEEAEELKLDLQDVKEMYKAQINHLLSQQS